MWETLNFCLQVHEPDPILRSQSQLSFEGFARYLMDSSNDAVGKGECESLDKPLSQYYIATSHNTYLSGHQLKGQSSVELYREVKILIQVCFCSCFLSDSQWNSTTLLVLMVSVQQSGTEQICFCRILTNSSRVGERYKKLVGAVLLTLIWSSSLWKPHFCRGDSNPLAPLVAPALSGNFC